MNTMKYTKILYLSRSEWINGVTFPCDSVMVEFVNHSIILCYDFKVKNKRLNICLYNPQTNKWVKTTIDSTSEYAAMLRREHRTKHRDLRHYETYMKHDRKRKHGSSGSREYVKAVTDYEPSKNPLHDFRRVRILPSM